MDRVRTSAPQLQGLIPYDPKYLPAQIILSANENTADLPEAIRAEVAEAISQVAFNRYPDPLANELRDMIAQVEGLTRDWVLCGNGGDELLFDITMAYGGPGRTLLNMPPTFSVYAANARLTLTNVVDVPRAPMDAPVPFAIDEEAVLARLAQGDIDFLVLTSPNNPTGQLVPRDFVERVLDATDALVVVDEAYFEFNEVTVADLLATHKNLLVLRTFSKAYSLAGVRIGYVLANPAVITELIKVRQPYSVDAVSQAIARAVFSHWEVFRAGARDIAAQRDRLLAGLAALPGVTVFPSDSNYVLFQVKNAGQVWEELYARGILVRDFSRSAGLTDCLRVSAGNAAENDAFLTALAEILAGQAGGEGSAAAAEN